MSRNQNVDKHERQQTETGTNQNFDKSRCRQTETLTDQNVDAHKRLRNSCNVL